MIPNLTFLIADPNTYFTLGIFAGLRRHFHGLGQEVQLTTAPCDKDRADIVFLAAELDSASIRYLMLRKIGPRHQRVFIIKDKPGLHDNLLFKHADGIFYRHQSLSWILQLTTQSVPTAPVRRLTPLTDREKQIMRYLAAGHRQCDISKMLSISDKTVSGHKHNVMKKLGIQRSSDLNYWLLQGGAGQTTLFEPNTCPVPSMSVAKTQPACLPPIN